MVLEAPDFWKLPYTFLLRIYYDMISGPNIMVHVALKVEVGSFHTPPITRPPALKLRTMPRELRS